MNNLKEKCICGHSKSVHADKLGDDYGGVCCATWQSRADGYIRFCECKEFIPECVLPQSKC